jgi:phosphoglycerol transferase MdoB-like AlkP superfamily enzyme
MLQKIQSSSSHKRRNCFFLLQVPQKYVDAHCTHIADADRRTKCGMIVAMDEAVANVTQALQQRGLMDNTLIVFSSDNGGITGVHATRDVNGEKTATSTST